jgi:lipopolysaccharide transport system permease protein
MIGVAMSMLMFLSPVFYPASSVPTMAQQLLYLNPLTFPMEELRAVLILGHQPDWWHWAVYFGVAMVIALSGMWLFQKARPAFADVI